MRALIILLVAAICNGAEVEFVGVMTNPKIALFALRESESAKSRWVALGEEIGGFTVLTYDGKTDTLTLVRSDRRLVLKLPESRVRPEKDEIVDGLARIMESQASKRFETYCIQSSGCCSPKKIWIAAFFAASFRLPARSRFERSPINLRRHLRTLCRR